MPSQDTKSILFTIDGWAVISPLTTIAAFDVDAENAPTGSVWIQVSNPEYFFDSSRTGFTLNREGAWISLYEGTTAPGVLRGRAIILDALYNNSGDFGLLIYPVDITTAQLRNLIESSTVEQVRLLDPYKFCSRIPSWISNTSEARDRYIPVLSKDVDITIGQKIDLKGGSTSVDGITMPMVLDTRFQTQNRIQKMFKEKADVFNYGDGQVHTTGTSLLAQQEDVIIYADDTTAANRPPSMASYTDYPWALPTTTDLTLALPNPTILDTEAIILEAETYEGLVAGFGQSYEYTISRGVDDTVKVAHPRFTTLFDGTPFIIGQTCEIWEVSSVMAETASYSEVYYGLVENITIGDGITSYNLELSSILFTPQVNTLFAKTTSSLYKTDRPNIVSNPKRGQFKARYRVSQINPEDTFSWVKVGEYIFPIIKMLQFDYDAALGGDNTLRRTYKDVWNIKDNDTISLNLGANITNSTTDFGYSIGFKTLYDKIIEVTAIQPLFEDVFGVPTVTIIDLLDNRFSFSVYNFFSLPSGDRDAILPEYSPWGFYPITKAKDAQNHTDFQLLKDRDGLFSDSAQKRIGDYITDGDVTIVNLFEAFTVGRTSLSEDGQRLDYVSTTSDLFEDGVGSISTYKVVHPIDVILQVLTSTGTGGFIVDSAAGVYKASPGYNGDWDLLPSEFGFGIPLDRIDLNSFARIFNGILRGSLLKNCYVELGESEDLLKFLNDQILKPLFLCLASDSQGKIRLISLLDLKDSVSTKALSTDSFVRQSGDRTRVSLAYEAEDLIDSLAYSWEEPWMPTYTDPKQQNSVTLLGTVSRQRDIQIGGVSFNLVARESIFNKIQASPIKYKLIWAPYQNNLEGLSREYIQSYRRIIPKMSFELFWEPNNSSLDIGDVFSFNLPQIPNSEGLVGQQGGLVIGKVVNIKVDRLNRTASYEAIVLGFDTVGTSLLWNLTAQLIGATSTDTWDTTASLFCFNIGPSTSTGEPIFEFDYSQFTIGSQIIVWNKNWEYVTDTTIVDVGTPNPQSILVADDTGFSTGLRITIGAQDNYNSIYAPFVTFLDVGQRFN